MTKAWENIGEPPVLRKQQLYFVLIHQIRNAVDAFLVPLRATHSESVFSKILLIFYNLHNLKLSFAIPKKWKKEIIMQFEQLQKDMIAAMKARDKVRKDAISALVSAAKPS